MVVQWFMSPAVWCEPWLGHVLVKDITYDLRDSNVLCKLKFKKITYANKTFSCYGTQICNSLPNNIKQCTSLDNFKTMLKACEGPKCQCSMCNVFN